MTETRSHDFAPTQRRRKSTVWSQSGRWFRIATLGLGLLALQCKPSEDNKSGLPRSETFYVAGWQWGEPSSFNPLLSNPDWPINGMNLIYETLLNYNSLTGKMEPLLAESYAQHEDSVEVTLNPAARWNDGKPVTAWDVVYTFALGQQFKSLNIAPIWQYLDSIKAFDDQGKEVAQPTDAPGYPRRVVFALKKEKLNPLVVLDALQGQRIVPEHVIAPMLAKLNNSLDEFNKLKFDKDVVSSGPYKLFSYSGEKIVVARDDNYWGNAALHGGQKPVVKYLVHPIYKSNDAFSIALQQGRLDISSTFVPRIWLKHQKGVHSWFEKEPYFLAAAMPMLIINHKHHPADDVHMRRAMGFAINYKDIRELAVSGYSEPLQPGLILPFGLEQKYFSAEDTKKYGTWNDPEQAKAELKAGGFTPVWAEDGTLIETRDKNGQKVPTMYIKSPTGWSDWESIVRIAVKSMRSVGIDAREKFVDASLFWNALFEGDFDMIMNTPASQPSPSKPWSRFETLLTTQDFAPLGEKMYKNMGRFNDPKSPGYIARIDELLALIPTLKDDAQLTAAYRELNVICMQQQPDLPLVYRPDAFYEFSQKHWSNLPTAENPYIPPLTPGDRLGTEMLWKIKPVLSN